jgi:hypothetical protein
MESQTLQATSAPAGGRNRRIWVALIVLCLIGAAAAARRIVVLMSPAATAPSASGNPLAGLDSNFDAKASLTLVHIVPSLLFVALLPIQFVSSVRVRHPSWHRWNGRVVMVLGIVIGVTALALSGHPVGGLVEGTATSLFGCFFLFCLVKAWWHIRNRRMALHREWAIRMSAILLGVATTRPIMAVFFATARLTHLTPQQFFGPAMWMGFVSTYIAGEVWIRRTRRKAW